MKGCDGVTTKKQHQMVFYSIKGSSIKNFLLIDLITGTGIYYAVKVISASVIMGMVGSVIGTEGIKWVPKIRKLSEPTQIKGMNRTAKK